MTLPETAPRPRDRRRSAFAPETVFDTDEGPVPAEWLGSGHRVKTRDAGVQAVVRVEATAASALSEGGTAVTLPADSLEDGVPGASVTVAPGHLVLVRHPAVELYFGATAVFVEAGDLVGINGIGRTRPGDDTVFLHPVLAGAAVVGTEGLDSAALGPDGAIPDHPVLHEGDALVLRDALRREWQAIRQSA